ncbi:MAG: DUF4143 domain-containing protein, partial [Candidatus Margulisbacteria bacterium]|nr:DUF4143 domain-containing protein [Candidatus Margulisiibacteriota bacterium]
EALSTSYSDDVFKYSTTAKSKYIQHIIDTAQNHCGSDVTYEKFGGSNFGSKEMHEAFNVLEKAMIVALIQGSPSTRLPLEYNERKRPKLIFLDTGLANYKLGIRSELLKTNDLNNLYRGRIAEQAVGRALLSLYNSKKTMVGYWYRNKKGSTSQIDYLLSLDEKIIPIEVKSGATGTLKSVFQFIEESNIDYAIRIYSGSPQIDSIETKSGKKFRLLSLPFYFLHRIEDLCNQFIQS